MAETREPGTPYRRTVEALELVGEHYDLREDLAVLRRSGDTWPQLAAALVAEGLAALLIETAPRVRGGGRGRR